MTGLLTGAVLVAAWWVVRWTIARHEERRFERAYQRDAKGIIEGAEPIALLGTRPGIVLLLHGYNDCPQSVSQMAVALHARGWSVRAPLLPGHGRTLQAFAASGADEWIGAARSELTAARATHDVVVLGGLSMGGAIALLLAAEVPDVRAVIAFAPYLHASIPVRILHALAPVAALGARYVWSGGDRSVHDPVASDAMISYRRSTPRLLAELQHLVVMARRALPGVRQPVLVVQSREDNRIPAASAKEAFDLIGSADKTLHWTTGNGHVVTVDYGHEAIERLVADWLDEHIAGATRPASGS